MLCNLRFLTYSDLFLTESVMYHTPVSSSCSCFVSYSISAPVYVYIWIGSWILKYITLCSIEKKFTLYHSSRFSKGLCLVVFLTHTDECITGYILFACNFYFSLYTSFTAAQRNHIPALIVTPSTQWYGLHNETLNYLGVLQLRWKHEKCTMNWNLSSASVDKILRLDAIWNYSQSAIENLLMKERISSETSWAFSWWIKWCPSRITTSLLGTRLLKVAPCRYSLVPPQSNPISLFPTINFAGTDTFEPCHGARSSQLRSMAR